MKIIIAALGTGGPDQLTLGVYAAIRQHYTYFRTCRHDTVQWLLDQGAQGESLDALYETSEDFDTLCEQIAQTVLDGARVHGDVVYAVPAGAGFGDITVRVLAARCREAGVQVQMLAGQGYFENAALKAGGLECAVVCTAAGLERMHINTKMPMVITEIDSEVTAGALEIKLLECYPEDHEIVFIEAQRVETIPLVELDRRENYLHTDTIVVPPVDILALSRYDFNRLLDIIAILRGRSEDGREGCPWDMEQTHETLKKPMVEEAYEVVDAIDSGDEMRLADELGDVLLQVVMHAQIGREFDEFDIMDVTTAVFRKMILRHPHVFAGAVAKDSDDVLAQWEVIKRGEKGLGGITAAMLDVPKALPALMRAAKVQKKAADVGFDFLQVEQAMQKVPEELDEVRTELDGDADKLLEELGDLLFAVVNLPRMLGIDAELALGRATDKFIARFECVEQMARAQGSEVAQLSMQELDLLWEKAKTRSNQE